jgi:hypothetical protein
VWWLAELFFDHKERQGRKGRQEEQGLDCSSLVSFASLAFFVIKK